MSFIYNNHSLHCSVIDLCQQVALLYSCGFCSGASRSEPSAALKGRPPSEISPSRARSTSDDEKLSENTRQLLRTTFETRASEAEPIPLDFLVFVLWVGGKTPVQNAAFYENASGNPGRASSIFRSIKDLLNKVISH